MSGIGAGAMRPQGGTVKFLQNGAPYVANMQDIAQFATTQWNNWEFITQTLFDTAIYPAAGIASLKLFQTPQGQGIGFGGSTKTPSDTNMLTPGSLSSGQMFVITQVELQFQPATPTVAAGLPSFFGAGAVAASVNDAWIFWRSGNLQLQILQKPYLNDGPMSVFPSQADFSVQGASSNATTPAASLFFGLAWGQVYGSPYSLSPNNLLIPETTNFGVSLSWPEGNQVVTNPARIVCRLRGMMARLAQ